MFCDCSAESLLAAWAFVKKALGSYRPLRPVVVVAGSGYGMLADGLNVRARIAFSDIPGVKAPTALGHKGEIVFASIANTDLVILVGRKHFYEDPSFVSLLHLMFLVWKLEPRLVLLTNAAGSLCPESLPVGMMMVIRDHISFIPSPFEGGTTPALQAVWPGMQFVPVSNSYSQVLRTAMKGAISYATRTHAVEGVYVANRGPRYETAAEVRFLRNQGWQTVGMSTAPEVEILRRCGIEYIAGLSTVTYLGAGLDGSEPSGEKVIDEMRTAMPIVRRTIYRFIESSVELVS